MIVNLRGTNGSGKSTVARALLAGQGVEEIALAPYATPKGEPRSIVGYAVPTLHLIVVGSYRTDCGGCDGIKTQDLICESVRLAAARAPNVFFEGVIVSTLYSRYCALSAELGGMTWAYLDTPLDECLARITARNGGKPIKTQLVADKIRSIEATRRKALASGERVELIDHREASDVVMGMFV